MRSKWGFVVASVFVLVTSVLLVPIHAQPYAAPREQPNPVASPVLFVENVGQFDRAARFQVLGSGKSLFLARDSLWYVVTQRNAVDNNRAEQQHKKLASQQPPATYRQAIVKVRFVGANQQPTVEPFSRLNIPISYFRGSDPSQWHSSVPVWSGVLYKNLYPNIDLEVGSQNGVLRQRIIAHAGADTSTVRIHVEGATSLQFKDNSIEATTDLGRLSLPFFQSVMNNQGVPIISSHQPRIDGLEIQTPFTTETIVRSAAVAPASTDLIYAGFLGGNDGVNEENGGSIALDSDGAAYITGYTISPNLSTPNGIDPSINGGFDAYIIKLQPNSTQVSYATFLGGNGGDRGNAIAVDSSGQVVITGITNSTDFPVFQAIDASYNGGTCGTISCRDIFVTKINTAGTGLVYSTYYGTSRDDWASNLAIDKNDAVYVTGSMDRTAVSGQTTNNIDAFILKIAPSGTFVYGYLFFKDGKTLGDDQGEAVVVDNSNNAYVVGYTESNDFDYKNGYSSQYKGNGDIFALKISANLVINYSTYIGGSGYDFPYDAVLGANGTVLVTGETTSSDFPMSSGNKGLSDIFAFRLNATGSVLNFSNTFGGVYEDYGTSISVNSKNEPYIVGYTRSADSTVDFITPGGLDITCGTDGNCNESPGFRFQDAFFAKLTTSGSLSYGTYLGGELQDFGNGLAIDSADDAYITGSTNSFEFPHTDGSVHSDGSNFVPFIAKIGEPPPPPPTDTPMPPPPTDTPVPPLPTATPTNTPLSRLSAYVPLVKAPEPTLPPTETPVPTVPQGPPTCNDVEPNNAAGQAKRLTTIGGPCQGSLDELSKDDYYFVDLQKGQSLTITLSGIPAGANYNLFLVDANDDDYVPPLASSGNNDEVLQLLSAPKNGRYYIDIYAQAKTAVANTYLLTVTSP